MSWRRFVGVMWLELRRSLGRPLFWILVLLLAFTAWGLSSGGMRIASGDSTVGGTKAWLTSEFANAQMLAFTVFLFYMFFIAVAAGMAVVHDDDLKVGPILHATPLRTSEYVYGKFAAILVSFLAILALHLALVMMFNHWVPSEAADEIRGPFAFGNYLKPALSFALPTIVFLSASSFAIGVWSRRPIIVFVLPIALILFCAFFLWNWSPSWLSVDLNRLLMVLDPAGFRWLNETWLSVDRGVHFYNSAPVGYDGVFWLNRGLLALGTIGSLVLAERSFARSLHGERLRRRRGWGLRRREAAAATPAGPLETARTSLRMAGAHVKAPGILSGSWTIARAELKELRSQAGLYLFIPLILLQSIQSLFAVGAFDTPLLATPGTLAVRAMNTLSLLICLLLLFYTVESMEREKRCGFDPIFRATPIRTPSLLFGKSIANGAVALFIVLVTLIGAMLVLAIQGKVGFDLRPFLLTWGLLLTPTLLVWGALVLAVYTLTGNRYTTYAVALALMALTGYKQMTGKMNWVFNWDLWNALRWSDLGSYQIDRAALLLNRLTVLGLAVFLVAFTLRIFARKERDASGTGGRLGPARLAKNGLRLLPYAAPPLITGIMLGIAVSNGFQGKATEKKTKDYWRRNVATWRDADYPSIRSVALALTIDPAKRSLHSQGTFSVVNHTEAPIRQIPFTGGTHWKNVKWTMNGEECTPDYRVDLYVFTPPAPLAPGDSLRVGFDFDGTFPRGITKNGGGTGEFVLPAGVVLTSFSPSFVPQLGYDESIGIDKDNRYESKEYADDFYYGITKPTYGLSHNTRTRVTITAPEEYRFNSIGVETENEVAGGLRTTTWESDHPVSFFNVVGGRWAEKRGDGTVIYYHPEHDYNLEEMSEALDAARRYYSEWFYPFPWRELKLSEFPALADYAQGFATNITFSESIGFLTKSDPRANLAFMVTAHEAAHQWWGNLLHPGEGPGGDILSEGMAHFSTLLLFEQVKGLRQRIEFAKRIESRYGDRRQADSERPLVKTDGSKEGDETVIYDKGGWVFWMLLQHLGRDATLRGLQEFITNAQGNPDHPVLQDFVETMRAYAPDSLAYEAFTKQWFFEVVVPEYRLANAKRVAEGNDWLVTVDVTNQGTGTMAVEIAAVRGERFPQEAGGREDEIAAASMAPASSAGTADAPTSGTAGAVAASDSDASAYREVRSTIALAAGETKTVTLRTAFEPEKVVVDPDALVLQLNREHAEADL